MKIKKEHSKKHKTIYKDDIDRLLLLWGRNLFLLMCPDHSPSEKEVSTENQSENMEADTEIMRKCYFLDFPSACFLETQTSCLGVVLSM